MSDTNTTYVIDTNVLLSGSFAFKDFANSVVVLSIKVIEELDKHKTAKGELGVSARSVIRKLEQVSQEGDILKGCVVDSAKLIICAWDDNLKEVLLANGLDDTPDNRILATALFFAKKPRRKNKTVLVSNDLALRIKARSVGVKSSPYSKEDTSQEIDEVYSGVKQYYIESEQIDLFYKKGECSIPDGISLFPNEYIVFVNTLNEKHTALGRRERDKIVSVSQNIAVSGIRSRNVKQTLALDALTNPDITMVSLLGIAGTGKTILSLAAAMDLVLTKKQYKKIVLIKNPISVPDSEIGFLPGSALDKLLPFYSNFLDILAELFPEKKQNVQMLIEHLIEIGVLELCPPTFLRGRSISDSLVIVDEFQNMSPYVAKTILTRIGDGSRVFVLGDINQTDNPKLDCYNNGLYYTLEAFKDEECAAHITLDKSERSSFAELAAKKL